MPQTLTVLGFNLLLVIAQLSFVVLYGAIRFSCCPSGRSPPTLPLTFGDRSFWAHFGENWARCGQLRVPGAGMDPCWCVLAVFLVSGRLAAVSVAPVRVFACS